MRDTTERPETIECGSNVLSGIDAAGIRRCLDLTCGAPTDWPVPREYEATNVSDVVARIVSGRLPAT